jgi:hypothetical protein
MNKDNFETLKQLAFNGNFNPLLNALDHNNSLLYKRDQWGYVILHWSCRYGLNELVIELLNRGCNIDILHPTGWNALMFAAECNRIETVLLLIDKGANLMNSTINGSNALSLYGLRTMPAITIQQKTECCNIMLYSWTEKQKRDTNWKRRWPLMQIIVAHELHNIYSKKIQDKENIKSLIENFSEKKRIYLLSQVFGNLIREIMAFV